MMSDYEVLVPDEACCHDFYVKFPGPTESACGERAPLGRARGPRNTLNTNVPRRRSADSRRARGVFVYSTCPRWRAPPWQHHDGPAECSRGRPRSELAAPI